MGILSFIKDNFMHVAPILIAGFLAIAIMFERYKALFKQFPIQNSEGWLSKINDLTLNGRFKDAVALCDEQKGKPVADLVKQALLRAHQPDELIQNGIEISLREATEKIQKRTSYLATIANVATLLGLLGTIAGLIASFEAVGHADPQQKSALLAAGISTAMNATMLGLAVAIPCMVMFSFLIARSNSMISELDQAGLKILDTLKQSCYADPKEERKVA